jgi:Ser/Thr protein kinase RdoA (MazF antagonist)
LKIILQQFGLEAAASVTPFGNGLINRTWVVENGKKKFILQKINRDVFKRPEDIAYNIRLIGEYLDRRQAAQSGQTPGTYFPMPLQTVSGKDLLKNDEGYFRVFPFIEDSYTIDIVQKPEQAYEAAKQFGKFTSLLAGFDTRKLRITIHDFHDLTLRYKQFQNVLERGNKERIETSKKIIAFINAQKHIAEEYEKIKTDPAFRVRVTHHDTKISNVLFDKNGKGLCVIDLDTVMPGYFISDVGDMIRTYLSPANEEEKDLSEIKIRKDFYEAIVIGYMSEVGDVLTEREKNSFLFAGKCMIYMQAIRFITDHLNNDIYYGAKYEGHNYLRAENQVVLLQRLLEFEKDQEGFKTV